MTSCPRPAKAPAYKLIYFDARGVIETARYLLKYGGVEFEDKRIKKEDWPKLKENTPFGQLPLLEYNGKKANQSVAICRYLAKVVKLAGKDDWEDLEIDAIVDTINDLRQKLVPAFLETDEAKKKTLIETVVAESFPYYLSRLDKIVEQNKGYLANGRLSWADFYLASMAPSFESFVGGAILEKYPNLKALKDKVEAFPAIKKWIEERPKTDS